MLSEMANKKHVPEQIANLFCFGRKREDDRLVRKTTMQRCQEWVNSLPDRPFDPEEQEKAKEKPTRDGEREFENAVGVTTPSMHDSWATSLGTVNSPPDQPLALQEEEEAAKKVARDGKRELKNGLRLFWSTGREWRISETRGRDRTVRERIRRDSLKKMD